MRTLMIAVVTCALARPAFGEPDPPPFITASDLMTDTDAFYFRYLNPDPALDSVSDWPIVGHLLDVSSNLIDAGIIADRLNQGLPVDEQPAFRHVKNIVDECAARLRVKAPHLFVENNPQPNAYVTRIKEPHLLVLTSSLYELYKDRPNELRFIIGHELGHLKCNHIRCFTVGHAVMHFIVGDQRIAGIKEDLVAHLMVGQLLSWYRHSEMSADRAGLLCVNGNVDTAQRALLRLQHGTKEDVDPEIVAREQIAFEKLPFVKIVRKIRSYRTTHPYISDRCLALKQWTTTRHYTLVAHRTLTLPPNKEIVIDEIHVTGLPDTDFGFDTESDPIIKAVVGAKEYKSGEFSNNNNPKLTDLRWSAPYVPNTRIIIEVLDYDGASGNDFIGSCILPIRTAKSGTAKVQLRRDIKEQSTEVNLPNVFVKYRVVTPKKG
jgi:Zn-dependent protease with chaperone function